MSEQIAGGCLTTLPIPLHKGTFGCMVVIDRSTGAFVKMWEGNTPRTYRERETAQYFILAKGDGGGDTVADAIQQALALRDIKGLLT